MLLKNPGIDPPVIAVAGSKRYAVRLLDRIVRATSAPASLVLDPFCGSGTTLVAAPRAGRRFGGGDIGALAVKTTAKRLEEEKIPFATGG